MRARFRILTCLVVALSCCADASSVFAQAGDPQVGTAPRNTASRYIFTVMGHVNEQRACELATSSPPLVEFINTFGRGLSPTASRSIRIIRNGRVIKTFYKPDLTERLMPGDLVVVDGKAAHGTIYRGGQSNAVSADGRIRIGILGVLPYPILLDEDEQQITRGWVARALGQSGIAAEQAKSITPRRFVRTDASTPLPDCSVVIFDRSTIDFSRLPLNKIPRPYDLAQASPPPPPRQPVARPYPQPGSVDIPRPLTQLPQARTAARPGYAAVPTAPPAAAAIGSPPPRAAASADTTPVPSIDNPLARDEEEQVRDLLTSPRSVPFERVVPNNAAATQSPSDSLPGRVKLEDDADLSADESSAAAPKPFSSFAEPGETAATNDPPEQAATAELELQPRPTTEPPSEIASRIAPPVESQRAASRPLETQVPDLQSADVPAAAVAAPRRAVEDSGMPFPAPVKSSSASPLRVAGIDIAESSADQQQGTRKADAVVTSPAGDAVLDQLTDARTVDLKQPAAWNWPLISVAIISCLAVAVAGMMMLVVARQDVSRPTPVVLGERYWLDRIIQNELPIDDEPVKLPQGEQLFGKAVPIRRLDAAHQSVPQPHFLAAGGESGIRRTSAPSPGDPESTGDDSPVSTTDPGTPNTTPYRDDRPDHSRPAVPLRPAAEHRTTTESSFEVASERSPSVTARPDTAKLERQTRGRGRAAPQPAAKQSSTGISLDISRLPTAQTGSVDGHAESTTVEQRTVRPKRHAFRVDSGHQGDQKSTSRETDAIPAPAARATAARSQFAGHRVQADDQPVVEAVVEPDEVDVEQPVESSSSVTPAVPRPRFLKRQRDAAAQSAVRVADAPAVKQQQDVAVEPARSVVETGDLLDRVLSSVRDGKRGDR